MNMKKIVLAIMLLILSAATYATPITGNVQKDGELDSHQVIDAQSGNPIDKATVSIPAAKVRAETDAQGRFQLNAKIKNDAIMSVEKEGYKPFSLTINEDILARPLKIGIEKSKPGDIIISQEVIHLGDDVFSDSSAHASEFKAKSVGPFYTKQFPIIKIDSNSDVYLIIGSIIGLDTKTARELRQNGGTNSYSSPTQIFFNGQLVADININGDNQEISIPRALVKEDAVNEVTVRTGKNLFTPYIDYDDIEFANLMLEVR